MEPSPLKPTVILPDAAPLVHLAAADALDVLTGLGPVVVVDIVALEVTFFRDKPYADRIGAWLESGASPNSNRPIEVAATELGGLYRLALERNLERPRNAGEIAIAEWLSMRLRQAGGPALVVYENGRVPGMLAREGVAATVAVATTRNVLGLAEQEGVIESAEAVWRRIAAAAPTANPVSARAYIEPTG